MTRFRIFYQSAEALGSAWVPSTLAEMQVEKGKLAIDVQEVKSITGTTYGAYGLDVPELADRGPSAPRRLPAVGWKPVATRSLLLDGDRALLVAAWSSYAVRQERPMNPLGLRWRMLRPA